jgi:hypothetical protein
MNELELLITASNSKITLHKLHTQAKLISANFLIIFLLTVSLWISTLVL